MDPEGTGPRAGRPLDPADRTLAPAVDATLEQHTADIAARPSAPPRPLVADETLAPDAARRPAAPHLLADETLAPDAARPAPHSLADETLAPGASRPAAPAGRSLIDASTLASPPLPPPRAPPAATLVSEPSWTDARPTHYPAFERGDQIGRYVVVGVLGEGGMGVVYAAYDPELDRKVAVKLVRARRGDDPEAHARLLREAQALAQLAHPNVVTIHDVGTLGQRVFIAMEFVEGHTLTDWLAHAPRRLPDVLAVFRAAAEGLARAHAAGLVHRDFKPDNVMVSPDGRVRVMDFGLARAEPRGPAVPAPAHVSAYVHTQVGALLGTPRFMAAEQWAGAGTDARTDQFAFCVALWLAVHREPPFPGDTAEELAAAVTAGRVRVPVGPRRAPAWLIRVLLRGLRPAPGERWPDMPALLHALARGQAGVRTRRVALACLALVLVAVGLGLRVRHREAARLAACDAAAAEISSVWDDGARDRLRAAFLATDAPFAAATADHVIPRLDRWTAEWSAARRTTCLAADATSEPAAACLDDRSDELAALLGTLREPDRPALARAIPAAAALPALTDCIAPWELARRPPPPADPDVRARLLALRHDLHRARSLQATAHPDAAGPLLDDILARAEAEAHPALIAEARYTLGQVALQRGDTARAEQQILRVFVDAGALGLDELATTAAIRLVEVLGTAGQRPEEALQWAHVADMLVRRQGRGEAPLAADLLAQRGDLHSLRSDFAAAERDITAALELRRALLGAEHPRVADTYIALGETARRAGDLARALAHYHQALALREADLGPDHPDTARALNNVALIHSIRGEPEAVPLLERAIAVYGAALGEDNPVYANFTVNLARAHQNLGDLDTARALVDRGVALWDRLPDHNHTNYSYALFVRATILADRGEHDLAIPAFARLLAEQERSFGVDHLDIAGVLRPYARVHLAHRDPAAALPLIDRAIAIEERHVGPQHIWVQESLEIRARILAALGRADEAIAALERVLAAPRSPNGDPHFHADVGFQLARRLLRRDRPRALELARAALADHAADPDHKRRDELAAWLRDPEAAELAFETAAAER